MGKGGGLCWAGTGQGRDGAQTASKIMQTCHFPSKEACMTSQSSQLDIQVETQVVRLTHQASLPCTCCTR